MQKSLFFVFSIFIGLGTFARENLPTITADSITVDIRVDDDYFVKGGWTLDSTKNPDIFSIGSKWLYDTKRVTFITDKDSISVTIAPGSKFDFIILLNNRIPCHIQISTLANPIFMNLGILIPIVFGFAILLFGLFIYRKKLDTSKLLVFGYMGPLLFWCMTFISGNIHGNYDHLRNVISELGAIGTKSEIVTSVALMIIAVMSVLFSVGFYRASQQVKLSVIPAILSFCMPITMIWAGIFTMGNEFHSMTGALPFLVILAFLLSYLLWKKNAALSGLRTISLFSFLISMLILLRLIKPFGYEYEGLIQRFFYLSWTIWTVSIAFYLSRQLRTEKQ